MRALLILLFWVSFVTEANEVTVKSPNKQLSLTFTDTNNIAQYRIDFEGKPVLGEGKLGFTFAEAAPMYRDFTVKEVSRNSVDNTWAQPWGEQTLIRDHHNELLVQFVSETDSQNTFLVRARVFDDGVGFRYEVPSQDKRVITRELTEFNFVDSHKATAYWIPAHGRERYEYLYRTTPLQEVYKAHTPFTVKYDNGVHVAIHEAALVDYAGMSLDKQELGRFSAALAPRHDGSLVHKNGPFTTPWRTVTIGDKATDLVNSYIALNLNEPNKLGDVSWIEPGKYVGIWWGMHIDDFTWGSGDKHGATTENTLRYMDFAAEHGFDGVLVEGWNIGWDGDWIANSELFSFTQSYPDFDLEKVTQYGKEKGVKLIGHHETSGGITNYEAQMEEGFALYQKVGVSQIKTGYVAHGQNLKVRDDNNLMRYEFTDSQRVVNHFIHNVKTAAKYQLSINTHESVKDTGLRRTYPNWISRESARGQEYNSGWAAPNPPEHIPMLAFTRMLAGPMDFTPGIFNFDYIRKNDGGVEWGKSNVMRPQTTIAKQLAQYVVLYSPIQMATDLPKNYEAKPDAFQFIKDVPTDWSESIALQGEVGDFIVMARKARAHKGYSADDWFVGAITDENAIDLTIPLDFLDKDKKYEAQIYVDGKDAHWETNPYALTIEHKKVTTTDTLSLHLAASGGAAVRFKALP
ncbi:alpha-glucosidase [Alteromonas sp. KUL42]|uniref:glycoside hydrolase family 97 protein n=1 Tax=Alteromonas sp. KUL42 TaxID=2480797 RepID=UPI001036D675|nr:glycoside hydrolase family 97 protein [Alteromonas sp. KUL42]TAP38348.1 glycoside hydrolase family 97 protein [Alteromonas sp. KUL42]GEA05594.1 alpha-glucosidase [Alteromonas sp. KUL42]